MSIEEPIEDRDLICIQRQINIELRQELAETKAKIWRAVLVLKAVDEYLSFIEFAGLLRKMVRDALKELKND